ncbi:hypothetical protein, partial [Gilliamella sp. Choc5-1]|uniref:hypothetical protein n=1 Tax=Gilliamella sp. Choc5-1 TaxID=3120238 RepID=UPI001C3FF805
PASTTLSIQSVPLPFSRDLLWLAQAEMVNPFFSTKVIAHAHRATAVFYFIFVFIVFSCPMMLTSWFALSIAS